MLKFNLDSIILNKSYNNKLSPIISSIKIIPSNLKTKKKNIAKIWRNFINSKREAFISLLDDIGINFTDLEKRTCFYCGNKIDFIDFFYLNSSLGIGKVVEIWQNIMIQFYCNKCSEK
ncbi:MAG: hypothetical protein KGD63_10605 [Candidatus Lokiarchaeota archaeon]|nr:hypothetical protein [Candidatus Lokiarchaeota archaeon]